MDRPSAYELRRNLYKPETPPYTAPVQRDLFDLANIEAVALASSGGISTQAQAQALPKSPVYCADCGEWLRSCCCSRD